jgi:ABC-2 type transport system ATP-binding protein
MSAVIEISNLSRSYDAKVVLNHVNLSLPKGQVLGLIGENGAGKTTLIKHILGLLKAQEGTVHVFGLDPVSDPAAVLANIGYLAEEDFLPGWMRVYELQRYYQGFYPNWDQAYADELTRKFDIDRKATIRQLSKGQRARVGLMAALSYRPELLLLDEPSSGLDPIVRREILGSIIRAVADDNRTVLFSSHLLSEIEQVADQVAMIKTGEILFLDTLDDVRTSHTRVTLRFNEVNEVKPDIEGAFCWEGHGLEWTCLYSGTSAAIEASAALLRAQIVDQNWLTLDEIFVARSLEGESCHR